MNDVRLDCKPLRNNVFRLFVLGTSHLENRRRIKVEEGDFDCKGVNILLINGYDEKFNFMVKENRIGLFISHPDGKYTLPLTSDLTLTTTEENCPYFIEVASRGTLQKVKVEIANGEGSTVSSGNAMVES